MTDIKKIKTKEDAIEEERKNGEPLINIVVRGMFGDLKDLPEYGDQDEVYREASRDMKNMDFSNFGDYVDSLVKIADFWQEKAEHYFEELKSGGAKFDDSGYVEEFLPPRNT